MPALRPTAALAWCLLVAPSVVARPVREPLGLRLELLGAVHSRPSSAQVDRSFVDVAAGLRAAVRRPVWGPLLLGLDVAVRGAVPQAVGAVALLPLIPVVEARGNTPHRVERGSWQAQAGGAGAVLLGLGQWSVEPTLGLGLTSGMRVTRFRLDARQDALRLLPTWGPYLAIGLATTMRPLCFRLDYVLGHELGPPPFGLRQPFATLQFGAGMSW